MVSPFLTPLTGIALVLAASPQAARPVEDQAWEEGADMFHGSCDRLTIPEADLTVGCAKTLSHWIYPNGRTSYWFAQFGKALVTFSGLNEKRVVEGGTLIIDKVTTSSGPQWQARSAPARGLCIIAEVHKGRFVFKCDAETAEGKFSGAFTSDGQPPEHPARQD